MTQTLVGTTEPTRDDYDKLKRDNAILKRDMRIIERELVRMFNSGSSELHELIHLIRLLKQR